LRRLRPAIIIVVFAFASEEKHRVALRTDERTLYFVAHWQKVARGIDVVGSGRLLHFEHVTVYGRLHTYIFYKERTISVRKN
jgi:hypothetical protein